MSYTFTSSIAPYLNEYIDFMVSVGYKQVSYLRHCKQLDTFFLSNNSNENELTQELVLNWLTRGENEPLKRFNARIGFIRKLAKYLNAAGYKAYVVPQNFSNPGSAPRRPYLLTDKELGEFFHEVDMVTSDDPFIPLLLSTAFRLIYTCGLRPNELRNLYWENVDIISGTIKIVNTKYHRERFIAMSDDMKKLLVSYITIRDVAYPESKYLFPDKQGNMYPSSWYQDWYKKFFALIKPDCPKEELPYVRVYDLRHRFASAVLHKWLDKGENIQNKLPYLQSYMGHKNIASTAYYVHLLPENLLKASGVEWETFKKMMPEVPEWED